jgi:hypothetical protein
MVKLSKQRKFKTENFKINYGLSTNTNKSSFINICGWCSLNNIDDLSSKDLDNEFKELKKQLDLETIFILMSKMNVRCSCEVFV